MKLATLVGDKGESAAAVWRDGEWRRLPFADLSVLLAQSDGRVDELGALVGEPLSGWRLGCPLPNPNKVICCGLNYADHISETGRELPQYPTLFAKHADTLIGPTDEIVLPAGLRVDWEAELAVVVGSEIRGADLAVATEAIAGFTVANDISVRDWQYRTPQWFQGKAWDRSTPIGPVIVTPDDLDPIAGVDVICRVNGEEVQRGDTSTLVFNTAELLAYVSTFTRLRPGDVVLTGTPGGIGSAMTPPRYLVDGDVVETSTPAVGTLRNRVRLITTDQSERSRP
jgi:acylpyruvate hydrolase